MASKDPKQVASTGGGFFASIASSLSNFGSLYQFNELIYDSLLTIVLCLLLLSLLGYEGLEVINPEGGTEDVEEEAKKGRWKEEVY